MFAAALSFDVLILMKMVDRHFTISSDSLLASRTSSKKPEDEVASSSANLHSTFIDFEGTTEPLSSDIRLLSNSLLRGAAALPFLFSGVCFSFDELLHDRFSFPLSSYGEDEITLLEPCPLCLD
ncbi:unnamed protein product [Linum tenue]|uniref:Uncharacterized protein n=1 Tax=Linum tenue TaxID=586396 RepID=A0AAV0RC62_9ROSI|nr:unnamed protein product [Linum tenue]